MQLKVKREDLADAFSAAQGIATTRTTRPVLQNALLSVKKDAVVLSATDMEVALVWTIPSENCDVKSEGRVLLPAARLAQIARSVEADEVSLKAEGNTCAIKGGRSSFEVTTDEVENFPGVPAAPGDDGLDMEGAKFAEMVKKTEFAAARESTRYALNGIHIQADDGVLEMVATDGRRMALMKEKIGSGAKMPEAIVPQRALAQVDRLKFEEEEKLRISVRERTIFFITGHATVASRLVEGNFPPYREVIPKDNDKHVKASRPALLSGLRQAAIMTSEDSRSVLLAFGEKELTVTGRAPDEGTGQISLDIEYEGEPVEVRFNPQFLIDALSASSAGDVTIDLKGPGDPAAIKDGSGFLYVAMPIQIT